MRLGLIDRITYIINAELFRLVHMLRRKAFTLAPHRIYSDNTTVVCCPHGPARSEHDARHDTTSWALEL